MTLGEASATATFLWGMIAVTERQNAKGKRQKAKVGGAHVDLRQFCLLPFALCLLPFLACSMPWHGADPPDPQPPFIVTLWCGPPLAEFDDSRAAEISAA